MRNSTLLLLALFLCSLTISCSSPEEKKERHYLKALEYIKRDDNKAAILELRNAIQIDAKYAAARYQLGLIYLEEGDANNAFRELIRAADLDHSNLDANLKAAEMYLMARQRDESRKLVSRLLANDPGYRDGLALLANLELIEGNFDKAEIAIEKIGDEVEESDRLLNIKGRIFAAQQRWDDAEATFKKAIEVNPDNFYNYQSLLFLYQNRQETDKTKTLLDEMTARFPDDPATHLLLAKVHDSEGNRELEEAELRKVIEIAPDAAQYRLMLFDYYRGVEDWSEAENVLIQARQAIPDNPDLDAALATLYFDQQKFSESKELLDKISVQNGGHGGVRLLNVRFMLKDGKTREGIEILKELGSDFPSWAEAQFYLGLAHLSVGQIDLAQQAVIKAIEIHRGNSKYHTLLAHIYQVQGEFDIAGREAAIALKLNPKNLRAALILSRSLLGDKQFDKGLKLLTDMNSQVPENPAILENLAIAYLGAGDRERSVATLNELLSITPGNNRAVAMLTALKFGEDRAGAEAFIREQIERGSENSGLYLLLGEIYAKQQKDQEALAAFEKAQELAPDNAQAYVAAGRLLVSQGKKDKAMEKYQAMIARRSDSIVGHMGVAALLESDGKNEEAMEKYRMVLTIKEDFAPAANNLAWLLASKDNADLGEALRLAMLAKQAYPEEPHIADTLGWVHYQRKSYSLAIPQFELALAGRPDDPIITYHLALALANHGEKDRAIELLETVLGTDAEFADRQKAADLLAELRTEVGASEKN